MKCCYIYVFDLIFKKNYQIVLIKKELKLQQLLLIEKKFGSLQFYCNLVI